MVWFTNDDYIHIILYELAIKFIVDWFIRLHSIGVVTISRLVDIADCLQTKRSPRSSLELLPRRRTMFMSAVCHSCISSLLQAESARVFRFVRDRVSSHSRAERRVGRSWLRRARKNRVLSFYFTLSLWFVRCSLFDIFSVRIHLIPPPHPLFN